MDEEKPSEDELLRDLDADDPDARNIACLRLGEGYSQSIPRLIAALDDPTLRVSAIISLTQLRAKEAVPYLLSVLEQGDAFVKGDVARALGMMNETSAVEPLLYELHNLVLSIPEDAREITSAACHSVCALVWAVVHLGGSAVADDLVELTQHPNARVRNYAIGGLQRLGDARWQNAKPIIPDSRVAQDDDMEQVFPDMWGHETWRIRRVPTAKFVSFAKHLDILFWDGAVLYVAGGDDVIPEPVQQVLRELRPADVQDFESEYPEIPYLHWYDIGLSGRPSVTRGFHVQIARASLDRLAKAIEQYGKVGYYGGKYVGEMFMVYKDEITLLIAYDYPSDPFYVSLEIPKERLEVFCRTVGLRYKRSRDFL